MKRMIVLTLAVFLFIISGCSNANIDEEREKLKTFLAKNEEFTCILDEQYNECVYSLPIGIGYPEKDAFVVTRTIDFSDSLTITESRQNTLKEVDNNEYIVYTDSDYNLENEEFTAEVTVKVRKWKDGELENQSTKLTAIYKDNGFSEKNSSLTDDEISEVKQIILENFDKTKVDWNVFFEKADVKKDDLY